LINTFKQKTAEYNETIDSYKNHDNVLIVDSERLFDKTLDKNLYSQIVDWFELGNSYEQAAEIHTLWWRLVKKAEQEIIQDLQKIYS
jgi:hypothetical protein